MERKDGKEKNTKRNGKDAKATKGTDSEKEIENRFNQAVLDLNESTEFDHVQVNDQIDEAVDNIVQCIQENLNETNQSSKVAQALESFFETN